MEGSNTKLEIRRRADPFFCQRIWDALKLCRLDRKASTKENIIKYCTKLPNLDVNNNPFGPVKYTKMQTRQ